MEQVAHQYKNDMQERINLPEVTLTIHPGDYYCILGISGAGKSTLLNIAAGMMAPSRGHVYFDDVDIYAASEKTGARYRRAKVGYMPQASSLLSNLSVFENIAFTQGITAKNVDAKKICGLLDMLSLWHVRKSYPAQLSGGEYRRAVLARTIAAQPELLIADEPTSNLDKASSQMVRDALETYRKRGCSVLVATHDEGFTGSGHIISTYYI
jgi:putative ABC transport system ATP-binding protein